MALYRGTGGGILRSLLGGVAGAEACCTCDYECVCADWVFDFTCSEDGLSANIEGTTLDFTGTACAGVITWGYDEEGTNQGDVFSWAAGGIAPLTLYFDFNAAATTPPLTSIFIRVLYSGPGTGSCDLVYELVLDCEPP